MQHASNFWPATYHWLHCSLHTGRPPSAPAIMRQSAHMVALLVRSGSS